MIRRSTSLLWILFFSSFLNLSACASTRALNQPEHHLKPYVVVVSIDGYRSDYTEIFHPKNLSEIQNEGTSAKALIPVFPSKTYPNHYSIVTGLYPENHGIVGNRFYDLNRPASDQHYQLSNRATVQDGSWYGGEPIWNTAEKAGMRSAIYFWPGSEAAIQGVRPTYSYIYDDKVPNSDRVKQVMTWLGLPVESRPHFIGIYFSDVDAAGHKFGVQSQELKNAVHSVDATIGQLREGLAQLDFPVHLIILSDHGMINMDPLKVEYIDDYVDLKGVLIGDLGPQALLSISDPAQLEKTAQELKKKAQHFKVYRRKEVPKKYHYSKNPRVGDLVLIAKAPYSIGTHDPSFKIPAGNHGYNAEETSEMLGIFYAVGPRFKQKTTIPAFQNIHIYPLLQKILELPVSEPPRIDGDPRILDGIYR